MSIPTPPASVPADPATAPAAGAAPAHAHKPRRGQHIPALDGLRGLAILLVLIFHFSQAGYHPNPAGFRAVLQKATAAGWIGVDLFFVLSGFLITSILVEAKGSDGYFKNFYMRRVLRIFPLYYGVLIVAGALSLVFADRLPPAYQTVAGNQWALWVYLQNFVRIDWMGFTHFWSLAVEEHFYLVWPAVVFFLSRRWAMAACVAMVLTALGLRVGFVSTFGPSEATYVSTFCRMDALALGSLLALFVHGGDGGGIGRLKGWAGIALAFAAATCAVLFVREGSFANKQPSIQAVGYTIVGIGSAALLVVAVNAPRASMAGRAFNAAWLRFLGKYSYGVYVFHGFVVAVLHAYWPVWKLRREIAGWAGQAAAPTGPFPDWTFYPALLAHVLAGAAASILLALLSWHLYEKHFLKLKRFFEYRAPTLEGIKAGS